MPKPITSYIMKEVISLDENKTLLDAAKKMTENHIGAIVVTGQSEKNSIFTERDLMRTLSKGGDPNTTLLKDVADVNPTTIAPNEKCSACINLMKEHKCRHLLVVDSNGNFIGIVSLRDVVQLLLEEKQELASFLENYIHSPY